MAIILNNKKSTYSGPNGYYTVETTNITNRTQTTVDISFKVTVNLGNSESLSGTGRPLTGGLYLQGNWYTFTIKNSSTSWSGTTKHYINVTKTVTGLTPTQSSITGVKFRSLGSSSSSTYGAILTATNCSDIEIPIGHLPPTLSLTSITETNQTMVSAGVSNNVFVAGMSKKTFVLNATFNDNAQATSYYIKNADVKYTTTSSSNPISIPLDFTTNALVTSNNQTTFYFGVTDNMGLTTEIGPYTYTAIPYTKPTIAGSTTVKRNGQLTGKVRLNISGAYFNGSVGNVANDITVIYAVTDISASSTVFEHVEPSSIIKSNGTFTVTNYEIGSDDTSASNYFDPTKQYEVVIYVQDAFNTTSLSKRITKGTPVWTEYADRVHFEKITVNGPIKEKNDCSYWTNSSITWSSGWEWKKMAWSGVTYNNTNISINNDNEFSIPANVSIVKVTLTCSYYNIDVSGGDKSFAVYKNGNFYLQLAYVNYSSANNFANVTGFTYVGVNEGDTLSFYISSGKTGTMRLFESTKCLIEIIA